VKYFVWLFLCLTTTSLFSQSNPLRPAGTASAVPPIAAADRKAQATILDSYGKLPLSFEANYGQTDPQVKFLSRTGAYSLFLTGDQAVFVLSPKTNVKTKTTTGNHPVPSKAASVLRMKLHDANLAARVIGADELSGKSNYLIGNDPKKWRTGVATYAKVKYEGIYSGIDLVYYGNDRQLEYDFIVSPHANPQRIAFTITGAQKITQTAQGGLLLKLNDSNSREELSWHKPTAYQERNGVRHEIPSTYRIGNQNQITFQLAKYDTTQPLYIDPLIYSTYLGGSGAENYPDDTGSIALDSAGNAYVAGVTCSTDFPTVNPFQPKYAGPPKGNGCGDAFVTKLNAAGSALVYSTYLGGSGADLAYGIVVDSGGSAYVTGSTSSADFPVTQGAAQTIYGGGSSDAFIAKLNADGSLAYSSYLGGSYGDSSYTIAVDSAANAYVVGATGSSNFPITAGAFQTVCNGGANCSSDGDGFVTKINPTGSALVYSTYLGGSANEGVLGVAVDGAGDAYVTGETASTDFPITSGAFQTTLNGSGNAFVTEVNPEGSALVYSTYLGGSYYDGGVSVALDSAGNAYVVGQADSANFPVTPGAFQTTCSNGCYDGDAFVSKLNPTGSALVYSTFLGGSGIDVAFDVVVDSAGTAYIAGYTYSGDFPTENPLQPYNRGRSDGFVTRINPSGSALVYSTYLGGSHDDGAHGIALDNAGNAYVTGWTGSPNFPTTSGAFQPFYNGEYDAFVSKLYILPGTTTTLTSSPNRSAYGEAVTFAAAVSSGLGSPPDGETISFMKGTTILGTGTLSGGTANFTTSTLKVGTTSVTAVYAGDSNFAASKSKAVSQVVNKATTTTTLTSSPNPSNVGQSVTFRANVTPEFGGKVTGSVAFYDGTTLLKTVPVTGAKYTTSTLTQGMHSITATYSGSISFDGSSASLTQTVN
jgi:hypothetical protein